MASDVETRLREMIDPLPVSLEGWEKAGECEIYTSDDLYRYINGGAELYISYRFEAMVSQPYTRGEDEIRLDLFDMGSSEGAFGVFSHSRESVDQFVAPDVESEYARGLLTFWKGRYYGSILAYPETESGKRLTQALARTITGQIDEASPRPDLVSVLPENDLVSYSDRFFWHHAWINDYHFFANENLLDLGEKAQVVMAKYRPAGSDRRPAVLIAVQYTDAETTAAAQARFSAAFLPKARDGLAEQEDGSWMGCRQSEDLLIVVADAADRETIVDLIERCVQQRAANQTGRP